MYAIYVKTLTSDTILENSYVFSKILFTIIRVQGYRIRWIFYFISKTVKIISRDLAFIELHVQFTKIHFKALMDLVFMPYTLEDFLF